MTPLRAMICDDEPLAIDRLADLLAQCRGVELLGSVLNGPELLEKVGALAPDLVLLDIEMPQFDGFDVVESLARLDWGAALPPPLIIFVTAHPEMAANAFDSGALDFISKPVRLSRLERALERARDARHAREARGRLAELSDQLDALKAAHHPGGEERLLWIQRRSDSVRVDIDSVDWIAAEGEYVRFHVGAKSYLQRVTLSAIAERLAVHGFVRIHRSTVVNAARVVSLEKSRWGVLTIGLRTGAQLPVGKNYRAAARTLAR